ncbi:hypothetical protein QQF64_015339 [Cirrhinus molitorella]|uniref:Uncharacterized protein n=1 Tax=Cirrhinus molitorella TaxID=172907 RepID=A0ABR3NUM6_9TELE
MKMCVITAMLFLVLSGQCGILAGKGRDEGKRKGGDDRKELHLEVRWALSVALSRQLVRWHQSLPGVSSGQSAQE